MSLSIATNLSALQAHNYLSATSDAAATAVQRLSSGFKINSASDNPSGLVISEGMKAQISGLGQAIDNTTHAMNMVKTAEGAMAEINKLLNNIRDVTVHAQNTGVNDPNAIAADQAQVDKMVGASTASPPPPSSTARTCSTARPPASNCSWAPTTARPPASTCPT